MTSKVHSLMLLQRVAKHADDALHRGGAPLPAPVRGLMRLAARVMTTVAHRI